MIQEAAGISAESSGPDPDKERRGIFCVNWEKRLSLCLWIRWMNGLRARVGCTKLRESEQAGNMPFCKNGLLSTSKVSIRKHAWSHKADTYHIWTFAARKIHVCKEHFLVWGNADYVAEWKQVFNSCVWVCVCTHILYTRALHTQILVGRTSNCQKR